jgi:trimeric autotransporter adhesin
MKKKISLIVVSALGLGLLGLAPANATSNSAVGSAGPAAVAGVLNIGTAANTTGSAVLGSTTGSSVGLVNVSDISGGLTAGTTQTATLLNTGTLVVYTTETSTGTNQYAAISVTGGVITNAVNNDALNVSSNVTAANGAVAKAGATAIAITPLAGATSITVQLYNGSSSIWSSASAATLAPTSGTLSGQITVTLAASSSAGVVSLANSGVYYASNSTDYNRTTDATASTTAGSSVAYNVTDYLNVRAKDAYGTAISSTTGLLQATATNGAFVGIGYQSAPTPLYSSAYLTGNAPDGAVVSVSNPTKNALTTTVTITYNNIVIGIKSVTFVGKVASIKVTPLSIGKLNTVDTSTASIAFADSAGNTIYPNSTSWPTSGLIADSSNPTGIVSALSLSTTPAVGTAGAIGWTCGATAGSSNVALTYVNLDGTVIKSNTFAASCAGDAYTYTAALDKTTYGPGDIATLSVTFKDSKGNLANDSANTIAQTGYVPTIVGSNLTAVSAPTASDVTTFGVAQYKFIVGNNAGRYTASVNFPYVGLAETVTYSIVTSETSLNDVLKGIVALIASINKQIAALQKLVIAKAKK